MKKDVFPAWLEVKKRHAGARMIIAPHELPEDRAGID
jgi:hypothetical protein